MLAAFHITFFGTQPTFTQVPPSAPDSITAVLAPYCAACWAQARPPLPPPMLMRSKASLDTVNSIQIETRKSMIYLNNNQLAGEVPFDRYRSHAGCDRRSDRIHRRHLQRAGESARKHQGFM